MVFRGLAIEKEKTGPRRGTRSSDRFYPLGRDRIEREAIERSRLLGRVESSARIANRPESGHLSLEAIEGRAELVIEVGISIAF